jgi:CxxC-x17-CxxC domain-containing protein
VNETGYRGGRSSDHARSPRDRRGFDRGSRQMYKSVCGDCGKECEVPFRPTGDRPVYCAECWAKNRPPRTEDRRRREYPREDRQRGPSPASEDVDLQILAELKRIRELLEKGANKGENQTPESASDRSRYKTGKKRVPSTAKTSE